MMKINCWCDLPLDHYSVEYRVKKWFTNNFLYGGNVEYYEHEFTMLLIENPTWYKNSTLNLCMSWLKGTYNDNEDQELVHHLLIDLIIRYTDVLNILKRTDIQLNEYVREYYL